LDIMKKYGVERISLNPQTFNLNTLEKLNRPLDRNKFDEMFEYSKKLGFIINMDLILGLPGETTEDILYTLEELKKYPAENLTTHVLAIKKASLLYKDNHSEQTLDYKKIEEKLYDITMGKNMKPYYMYRQKNSVDWGENLGFATEGTESIFNIEMIEENQSTLGLGGGAITKAIIEVAGEVDNIKRIVSPKEPIAYVRQMRERLPKKLELFK
ncbi:MAG: radical SAM protein, partial [Psychrilyobacter sp.]|nr:radical SAM protein [Psychrilyobacter sp.]